jgi:hypothetical protein
MKTPSTRTLQTRQHGVVLLFCLIILVILLAGGVAVVRSMNSSLSSAGNLAFKRDLVNQGELAVSKAMLAFRTGGGLATAAQTAVNVPAENYSATELRSNTRGIPEVLLKKTSLSGPDISGATFTPTGAAITGRSDDVTVRYVIDRLCNSAGAFATLGNSGCVSVPSATQVTGGTAGMPKPDLPAPVIYRLSIRVDGPRDTQVFLQSSFSRPE